MTFTKIAIAGSSGRIATYLIPLLLSSTSPTFHLTLLTRSSSSSPPTIHPNVTTIPVDYTDHAALVRALNGSDVLLSLISGFPSKFTDRLLLRAAEEAGVRRMFPSEMTLDVLHPGAVQALTTGGDWPEDLSAVPTARWFEGLPARGSSVSFTTIMTGAFMNGWLDGEFGLFDPRGRSVGIIDGGGHHFTGVSYKYLAEVIVAIIKMDEEKTKNKRIAVAEVRATINEIVDLYDELSPGPKFERKAITSAEILKQRDEWLAKAKEGGLSYEEKVQHVGMANAMGVTVAAFGGSGAGDLKEALDFDADGLLGYEKKTLRELVEESVQRVSEK